jgi:hypothetical protein
LLVSDWHYTLNDHPLKEISIFGVLLNGVLVEQVESNGYADCMVRVTGGLKTYFFNDVGHVPGWYVGIIAERIDICSELNPVGGNDE